MPERAGDRRFWLMFWLAAYAWMGFGRWIGAW